MRIKKNLIIFTIILLPLNSNNIFSTENNDKLSDPRDEIGFSFVFPFPIGLEINTKLFDIGVGIDFLDIRDFLSSNIVGTFYIYYIFLNYRLVENKNFFFFMGSGLFFNGGRVSIIEHNKIYSGFAYKIGIGLPIGFTFQIYRSSLEITIRAVPLLFVGQHPNGNFIFPLSGNFSIGFRGWPFKNNNFKNNKLV